MVLRIFTRSPSVVVSKSGTGDNTPIELAQSSSPSSDRICSTNTVEIQGNLTLPTSCGPGEDAVSEVTKELDGWKFAAREIDDTEELDNVISVHHTQEDEDCTANATVLGGGLTARETKEVWSNSDVHPFDSNTVEIEEISSELASDNEIVSSPTEEQFSRYDVVFGSAPTRLEVEEAVSDINYFRVSSLKHSEECLEASGADSALAALESNRPNELNDLSDVDDRTISSRDWIEPVLQHSYSSDFQYYGSSAVSHAFSLLRSDPQFKEMVISLASDDALWDAVMSNKKVVEFQKRFEEAPLRQHVTSEEAVDEGCKQCCCCSVGS
eukprot:TRINITY_DN2817_c0_g1_i6.p1 TRINITY_DN2817_c0_g1~~TRINITY_DN2817_c0_g1_i6.p1  ORF type:complete len:362 (+),score=69.65 TRINITY_DN2817_c0_g1_i6:111-1088(+)